jgi:transposase
MIAPAKHGAGNHIDAESARVFGGVQLFAWKRRMLEGGAAAVHADEDVVGASRVRELEKRVRDLERMLGRKTMEAEILKEALDLASPKKPVLRLASFDKDASR